LTASLSGSSQASPNAEQSHSLDSPCTAATPQVSPQRHTEERERRRPLRSGADKGFCVSYAQLGEKDRVTIHHRGGATSHTRQDRRVVSKSVAAALAEACSDAALFLPWCAWRARGRTITVSALRQHPDYGPGLRELDDARIAHVLDLAGDVLRGLTPGLTLTPELRDAVTAGVCVALTDTSARKSSSFFAIALRPTRISVISACRD